MDLRKPKRFATFSLGLGKKKKKHNENISKSSFGLSNADAGNEVTRYFNLRRGFKMERDAQLKGLLICCTVGKLDRWMDRWEGRQIYR